MLTISRHLPLCARYKWDNLPAAQRPERGLLRLRSSLNAFANLRPSTVLPQLADASTLKREVRWPPPMRGGCSVRVLFNGLLEAAVEWGGLRLAAELVLVGEVEGSTER